MYHSYQNRYDSTWYKTPVKIQKLIFVMQIRCKKLCSLSAGGLYDMNIENFGIVSAITIIQITMHQRLRQIFHFILYKRFAKEFYCLAVSFPRF